MVRYSDPQFLISSRLFRPVVGEMEAADENEARRSASELDGPAEHDEDYINVGHYGKELAAFIEIGLRGANLPVAENYADDYGRIIRLVAPNGAVVEVACVNDDPTEANKDGDGHLVAVFPRPRLLSRLLTNSELAILSKRIAEEIEKLLLSSPEIKLVRKYACPP